MANHLEQRYPRLALQVPRVGLAKLPTPVDVAEISLEGMRLPVVVKRDDLTASLYGGNKVRKLEYLLQRAKDRGASRVATFGAVASNHAMATSLFSQQQGMSCVCFLAHQTRTPAAGRSLNMHREIGTEVVDYHGSRQHCVQTLRRHLYQQKTWVVPMGGTSWLGALGFVDAGLELAEQIRAGACPEPDELYVAMGTMGTVAGIALGLVLAGLRTRVQAVRVTADFVANPDMLKRLVKKTAMMMHELDPAIPDNLAGQVNIEYRPEFFGPGYAKTTPESDRAVALAGEQLGLSLEQTYTGKAFAALLSDRRSDACTMFWNTYNSTPLPTDTKRPEDVTGIPEAFLSYFD